MQINKAYAKFSEHTSDIRLPVVEILRERKAELWTLVKCQRDPVEIARLQGRMEEVDEQLKRLLEP